MNKNQYGEVINGTDTYNEIEHILRMGRSVLVGWIDEGGSFYNILFSLSPYREPGNVLQRGLKGINELYVSIIGYGTFGFDTDTEKHSSYIAEKLNIYGDTTREKLTELINEIIKRIRGDYIQ